jgi:hypothetical protein
MAVAKCPAVFGRFSVISICFCSSERTVEQPPVILSRSPLESSRACFEKVSHGAAETDFAEERIGNCVQKFDEAILQVLRLGGFAQAPKACLPDIGRPPSRLPLQRSKQTDRSLGLETHELPPTFQQALTPIGLP